MQVMRAIQGVFDNEYLSFRRKSTFILRTTTDVYATHGDDALRFESRR